MSFCFSSGRLAIWFRNGSFWYRALRSGGKQTPFEVSVNYSALRTTKHVCDWKDTCCHRDLWKYGKIQAVVWRMGLLGRQVISAESSLRWTYGSPQDFMGGRGRGIIWNWQNILETLAERLNISQKEEYPAKLLPINKVPHTAQLPPKPFHC